MSKLSKILLLIILISQSLWAQEPIYRWGEPATNDNTERKIDQLITLGNDGFILLRKHQDITYTTTYWLEYYDAKLKLQGTRQIDFNAGVMGNSYNIESISVANGVIYAFVTHWEKAAEKHTLSIKKISVEGEMSDVKDLDVIKAKKMGNKGMFDVSFSDDGSKLLVISELPFVKKTTEKIRLNCFDVSSMSPIWSFDKELSWPSKRASNNEIAVDNKGQAYLFKKIWQKPEWKYSLYSFDGKENWTNFSSLGLDGLEIVDYKIKFDQKNEFVLYATVTKKPSNYKKLLHSSWFVHLPADLKSSTIQLEPWNKEILTRFGGDKMASQGENGHIDDFYIKDLLFREDGNMLVLMEKLRTDKKPIAGSSPIKYSYKWNYGGVLAICLNSAGKLIWWQDFNKRQEINSNENTDKYGSFVYHLKEDRLYILWNNTVLSVPSIPPANWKEPDGTKYVKHKAFDDKTVHATFMHVIEPDGSMAYKNRKFGLPLFKLHEGAVFEMSLTTPFFFVLNGDLVVMSAMHNGGKRYRFGFIGL